MTIVKKERKGKGLLYLIAIAVLIAIVSIACSDKPTAVSDFAEIDDRLLENGTTSSGQKFEKLTLKDTANADSPVVVVSGNNLILVYGKDNKIYYISSHDGGTTRTEAEEFGRNSKGTALALSKKYPHIFFDKNNNINAIATARYNSDGSVGKVKDGSYPLVAITGKFIMKSTGDGKQVGSISFSSWETVGIILDTGTSGNAGNALNTAFGGDTTVKIASGIGRFEKSKYIVPVTDINNGKYLKLEADTNFLVWRKNSEGVKSDITKGNIVKFDESGVKFEINENSIVEKAGSGSTAVSITAKGKVSVGNSEKGTVGDGTSEASIATDGNGNIYTLTKETGGLVFRKFGTSISGDIK